MLFAEQTEWMNGNESKSSKNYNEIIWNEAMQR